MPKNKQCAVLDIGSEKLSVIAGERGINKLINIKGFGDAPYSGFMNGEFLEPQKLHRAVKKAVSRAEESMKSRIKDIYVAVPAEFCTVAVSEGVINFKTRRKVTDIDIEELYLNAPKNKNFTHIGGSPVYYILDGGNKTLEPVGSYCMQLKGLLSFCYAENRFIGLFENMLGNMGLKAKFICSPLAACGALFDDPQKQYLIADVGYITSGVALYQGEGLLFLKSFSMGGGHIAADLMECLHISFNLAQRLKEQIKLNLEAEEDDKYKVTAGEESCEVSMKTAHEVAAARIERIGALIARCVKESGADIPAYLPLYLTGGGISYIRGAAGILSNILDKNVDIAAPQLPKYDKPDMSSGIGALEYALRDTEKRKKGFWARLFS